MNSCIIFVFGPDQDEFSFQLDSFIHTCGFAPYLITADQFDYISAAERIVIVNGWKPVCQPFDGIFTVQVGGPRVMPVDFYVDCTEQEARRVWQSIALQMQYVEQNNKIE